MRHVARWVLVLPGTANAPVSRLAGRKWLTFADGKVTKVTVAEGHLGFTRSGSTTPGPGHSSHRGAHDASPEERSATPAGGSTYDAAALLVRRPFTGCWHMLLVYELRLFLRRCASTTNKWRPLACVSATRCRWWTSQQVPRGRVFCELKML